MNKVTRNAGWSGTEVFVVRRPVRVNWAEVGIGLAVMLVISLPTMTIEENWRHGRPMIDQHTLWWIAAAVVVLGAFFLAGLVLGYRRPASAAVDSAVAAGLAVAVLLVGAMYRRVWVVHEGTPEIVLKWLVLGAVGAVAASLYGSRLGRRRAWR